MAGRRTQHPDDGVLGELADLAGYLDTAGMGEQAALVRKAAAIAREDPEKAAAVLKELAAVVAAQVPAYSHGAGEVLARMRCVLLNCEQHFHRRLAG